MEIAGVPQSIDHVAWTDFLRSVGFDATGRIRRIETVDSDEIGRLHAGLRVTTSNGDVVIVPFDEGRRV